jgi:hypothetical protein
MRIFGLRIWTVIGLVLFAAVGLVVLWFTVGRGSQPGDVLLEDDFSEASSRWPAGATDGGFTSFSDGVYRIGVDPDSSLSAVTDLDAEAPPNVRVTVDVVKTPSEGAVLFGLGCRVRSGGRFDELVISTSGRWAIVQSPDRQVLGQGSFEPSLLGSGPVRLEAACTGGEAGGPTRLALSVNGTTVGRGTDAGDPGTGPGGVGMAVENGAGDPADVRFDDFRVTVA